MKRIFPFLFLIQTILFTNLLIAGHLQVSGTASGRWNADTVKVTGDLLVPAEMKLVIDPGVVIIFSGHYQIKVEGSVVATGTIDAPVIFSVSDTTGFADTTVVSGGWHGFLFDNTDASEDSSKFSYCLFEYGKAVASDTTGRYGGAFRIFGFSKVVLEHCIFRNNLAYHWGGAMFMKHSDIVIRNCTFISNHCGLPGIPYGYGGALCFVSSNPVVESCYFEKNSSTGVGGGASFEYSDAVVRFNTFFDNNSALGGALCYLRSNPVNVVSNNLFNENEALYFGGGIACLRANTTFVNNTIINNISAYGGGFYANDSAFPSSYNTLFYGNSAFEGVEVYIWDVYSAPDFYYCNVPGGKEEFAGSGGHEGYTGHYENNMDTVPMFTGSGDFPFALAKDSPFVDAGREKTDSLQVPERDLAGNQRIYNGRIDIGAYEWNPGEGIPFLRHPDLVTVSPNPCPENAVFRFHLDSQSLLMAKIYDQGGKLVKTLGNQKFNEGTNRIGWDLSNESGEHSSPGIYTCILTGDHFHGSVKLVVVP